MYLNLEFKAKRLCGEPDIPGANGDKCAPYRWGLASYQGSPPRTMPGEIEDQPNELPDGRVFPVTRQAELRMPGTINSTLEGRVVMFSLALLNYSRRTAPLRTEDEPPLHDLAAGRAAHDNVGSWVVGSQGVCVRYVRKR